MFTKYDKKKVNAILEKAQLYLVPFQGESDELQNLRHAVIHLQIALDRIETEGD